MSDQQEVASGSATDGRTEPTLGGDGGNVSSDSGPGAPAVADASGLAARGATAALDRTSAAAVRPTIGIAVAVAATALAATPAAAHVGSLGAVAGSSAVPLWYVLLAGGAAVGGSFLFTSLLTDHEGVRMVNGWRLPVRLPHSALAGWRRLLGVTGVAVLVAVVLSGLFGPTDPFVSLAVLVVWAGWWAGYTASTYLLGDTWPAANPWRTLAGWGTRVRAGLTGSQPGREPAEPDGGAADAVRVPLVGEIAVDPARWGAWPSVVGLLALVYVEVTTPLAEDPRLLAGVVLAYTVATVVGAVALGPAVWFGSIDPVSRVFRWYGRIAPFGRLGDDVTGDPSDDASEPEPASAGGSGVDPERDSAPGTAGLELRLPGAGLTRLGAPARDETAFVVALLWATTYDGLVSTPAWNDLARPVVSAGVPGLVVYAVLLVGGFGAFLAVYRLAARNARTWADTYVTADYLERWFVPSLVPIAAGYHLAHFSSYFLTLSPALAGVLANPLSPPAPVFVVVPGWFDTIQLLVVLLGHVLAVWVAHAVALDIFPGRLRPVRSQYPLIVVMVVYTTTSLWIVAQPYVAPVGL